MYLRHSGEFTPGDFYFDVSQGFICLCCMFLMTSLQKIAFKMDFIDQLLICIIINTERNLRRCNVYTRLSRTFWVKRVFDLFHLIVWWVP